ncbi:MAG TPA: family 1 glycosylhydrolase [Marmoricola sp.]|nr:family 1 glycosylhydrolase [Marmoricola sp.]
MTRAGTPTASRNWTGRLAAIGLALTAVMTLTLTSTSAAPTGVKTSPVAPLPKNFLWGVASAGFQVEGNTPDSNWRRYIAKSGNDPIKNADDFFHRYRSDIALAKSLGVKVYRISIEWARLEPKPGVYNPAAWTFYDNVVKAIKAAGMRPMLTIDHWVYPGWEASRGGWARSGMVNDWLANAKRVVNRYKRYNPLWVTINEANMYGLQEVSKGGMNPTDLPTMMGRLVTVHNAIYRYIHHVQPHAMVTSNVAYIPSLEPVLDALFLSKAKLDFVGIDYYYPVSVSDPVTAFYAFINQSYKSGLAPEGIYYALRHYADLYPKKPLYIVENGMPTENGKKRPDGWTRAADLQDTIYWVQRARAAGMNVIGYNYWSLTDNYEWGSYTPRFGLYTVNALTDPRLRRIPTDAVPAYRGDIARGGVPKGYQLSRGMQTCSLVDGPASCLNPVTP